MTSSPFPGWLLGLLALAGCYIIGSSFLGINGAHVWRQSDVLGQIYDFTGHKGLRPFLDFTLDTAIFDLPIYQYLIARISRFVDADPLVVTRYVDLLFWVIFVASAYRLLEFLSPLSGLFFAFLAGTSPLFLHYFSVPLPDVMSIALAMAGLCIHFTTRRSIGRTAIVAALFSVAALIKSPIPFVFLTFLVVAEVSASKPLSARAMLRLSPVLIASALSAIAAEWTRREVYGSNVGGFAQDSEWYFGTIAQRLSPDLWKVAAGRLMESFSFGFVGYTAIAVFLLAVVMMRAKDRQDLSTIGACLLAFASGWLVFTNLYLIHDYYNLPTLVFLYGAFAVAFANLLRRVKGRMGSAPVVNALGYASVLIASLCIVFMPKKSDADRAGFLAALPFLMRDVERFALVSEDYDGPSMGGYAQTPFVRISHLVLDENCLASIDQHAAILVRGRSACLESNRQRAGIYILTPDWQFFRKERISEAQPPE